MTSDFEIAILYDIFKKKSFLRFDKDLSIPRVEPTQLEPSEYHC